MQPLYCGHTGGLLKERDDSIRRQLAAAKAAQSVLLGHDLMGIERFMPETRHMITLDVLNNDSPVGYKENTTASSSPMKGIRTQGAANSAAKSQSKAMPPYPAGNSALTGS